MVRKHITTTKVENQIDANSMVSSCSIGKESTDANTGFSLVILMGNNIAKCSN